MNIYIFGFDKSYASSIMGLMDIFHHANQLLLKTRQRSNVKAISIKLVSADGKPIMCQNNILLNVDGSFEDIQQADLVIITQIHDVHDILSKYPFIVNQLKDYYKKGTAIASICTGAFLLAETGLLNGREATTHWAASSILKNHYPKLHVNTEKLIIDQDNLYCTGGKSSSIYLAFYLLEKYFGHSLAAKTAKFFLYDFRRASQQVYAVYKGNTEHNDVKILKIQEWISCHLKESISIKELPNMFGMSQRTFERRFKNATGDSPIHYIQKLKVENAKQKLETTNKSFEEISYEFGYMNSGSFRKIFVKWVHLLPSEYKKRFKAYN